MPACRGQRPTGRARPPTSRAGLRHQRCGFDLDQQRAAKLTFAAEHFIVGVDLVLDARARVRLAHDLVEVEGLVVRYPINRGIVGALRDGA